MPKLGDKVSRYRPATNLITLNNKIYDLRQYVVAHWGFEDTVPLLGSVPDLSGNSHNGTLINAASVSTDIYPGVIERGRLRFNPAGVSNNNRMNVPASSAFLFDRNFSISLWVRFSNAGVSYQDLLISEDNYKLYYNGTNKTILLTWYSAIDPAENFTISYRLPNYATFTDNEWLHVVFTNSGDSLSEYSDAFSAASWVAFAYLKAYVNGKRAALFGYGSSSGSGWFGVATNPNPLQFRVNAPLLGDNPPRSFGSIEWWSKELSNDEVYAIYQSQINEFSSLLFNKSGFISRSPRLHVRELDDLPGSYSTVRRTGDPTRTGALESAFNDSTTIIFSDSGNPTFPAVIPRGNEFNAQAVDIVGQESDINITTKIKPYQQPNHLHYSPVEEIGPFDEVRTLPASSFFLNGTSPEVLPGFDAPLRSKVAIEIDITPNFSTTITRNVESRNNQESQPDSSDNTGFYYFNFEERKWQQIGKTAPVTGEILYYDYDIGTSVATASLPSQFSMSPCTPYVDDDEKVTLGYSKIGTPISNFGAPSDTKYYATSSQALNLSRYISGPFLLEAIKVDFGQVTARRIQGDSHVSVFSPPEPLLEYMFQSGSIRDIDNYVFFAYRQNRNGRLADTTAAVTSSDRFLVFSGSMTFWNSASFRSLNDRYETPVDNFSLMHNPAFSYEFGLPFGSSLDVRLTDWDPGHDTYYFNSLPLDLTSKIVAHFNFESDADATDTVADKTGNGHVATLGGNAEVRTTVDMLPRRIINYPAFAYISNRGSMRGTGLNDTALLIDHAADLETARNESFAISFWASTIGQSYPPINDTYFISKGTTTIDYSVHFDSSKYLYFRVYHAGSTGVANDYLGVRTTLPVDLDLVGGGTEWNHLSFVYNGGFLDIASLFIFINGVRVSVSPSSNNRVPGTGANFASFSPLNTGAPVRVARLQSGGVSRNFLGKIGSLEFYQDASILAFTDDIMRAIYLLQETPYVNQIEQRTGTFVGPISMNLSPAVVNRQLLGISRFFSRNTQNGWIGGTAAERFENSNWNRGSITTYPANPFYVGEDSVTGLGGRTLDQADFIQKVDSRALKNFGNDSVNQNDQILGTTSEIYSTYHDVPQSTISPYLLFPEDELIFGLEAGIPAMQLDSPGFISNLTGSHLIMGTKTCKVTLIGSMISDGKPATNSLNQDLSSNSIHEVIGAEPILDQFMIEPRSSYYGSYLDEIVTGSMAVLNSDGTTFTIYDQDNSRRVVGRALS